MMAASTKLGARLTSTGEPVAVFADRARLGDALRPLQGKYQFLPCPDVQGLLQQLARGTAAVLVEENRLDASGLRVLKEWVVRQPLWSELPFIVIGNKESKVAAALGRRAPACVLEPGAKPAAVSAAISAALRARRRQYALRDALQERSKTEESSRLILQRLRVVLKNTPILLCAVDADLRYTWVYNPWRARASRDFIGKRDDELMSAHNGHQIMQFKREVLQTGVGGRRILEANYSGSNRIYDVTAEPIRAPGGEIEGVTVAAFDITDRVRAEESVRRNEELFRRVFEESPVGMALIKPGFRFAKVNPALSQLLGYSEEELRRLSIHDITHPEDCKVGIQESRNLIKGKISRFRVEKRYISKAGQVVWADVVVADIQVNHADRSHPLALAIVEDVTERKKAEEALVGERHRAEQALDRTTGELRRLAASLLNAQERERRRVARELHDDLSQRLAMLEVNAQLLSRKTKLPSEARTQFEDFCSQVGELSEDVRKIAYALHPSTLDVLGLPAALCALAEEFQRVESMPVKFDARDVPEQVPPEIATCLYRVAQEALRNIAKHAGKTAVRIVLRSDRRGLHLMIRDRGKGFDLSSLSRSQQGLGVVSMQERAGLVNGKFSLRSWPKKGTSVRVTVPLTGS